MTSPQMTEIPSAPPQIRLGGRWRSLDVVLGLALAALLVLLSFATGSGVVEGSSVHLGTNTWAEIALTFIGAAALVTVLLWSARGPAYGAVALLAFAALTTLSALSIAWSVQPDTSWSAANQSVAYLGAFGAAIALARLFPERWAAVCWALPLLAVVISGYALLAKVFPALPDSESTLGRVTAPIGYWNAVGLVAGFGLPGFLWLGSRPGHGRLVRAATIPAISLLATTVVLSYSRSADAAAVLAVALLLALAPTRMRMVLVLLPGLLSAAVLSLRALSNHHLSDNFSNGMLDGDPHPLAARTVAGHSFGWFLLVVVILTSLAGFAIITVADRTTLTAQWHRRIVAALAVLAACVPLAGVAALAGSHRGLTGEVSHLWSTLTSTKASIGTGPNRITTLANSRPRYWHDALLVGSHHPLLGAGALGFGTARTRYSTYQYQSKTAHSYLFQTFADLGLVGVLLSILLFVAWWRSAWSTIGRARIDEEPSRYADERTGLIMLLTVVVCFGVSSAIDWTWLVPATAIPALVCAGWLAGRGPLVAPVGRVPRRRQLLSHPALPLSVTAVVAVALGLAWGIWQPLRSVQAENAAVAEAAQGQLAAAAGKNALASRDAAQAFAEAHAAVARDPFSLSAMTGLASLYEATNQLRQARSELVLETQRQSQDYQSWYQLGDFDLRHARIRDALSELGRAAHLDPFYVPTLVDEQAAGAAASRLRPAAHAPGAGAAGATGAGP